MSNKLIQVYKASAGSGKTFTLTAQYLAMLLSTDYVGAYKHILAVTFTVKATGEMKDRILGTLYDIAAIHQQQLAEEQRSKNVNGYLKKIAEIMKDDPKATFTEAEVMTVSKRAQRVLIEILHNYDQFKVSTIDSFLQSVMKGVARELGLPAHLTTEVSDNEVRKLATEQLMASLTFEKDTEQLRNQLWRFVKDKIDNGQSWAVSEQIETFSNQLAKETYREHSAKLKSLFEQNPQLLVDFRTKLIKVSKKCEADIKTQATDLSQYLSGVPQTGLSQRDFKNICSGVNKIADLNDNIGTTIPSYASGEKDFSKMLLKQYADDPQCLSVAADICEKVKCLYDQYILISHDYISVNLALQNLHQLGLLSKIDDIISEINAENEQFLLSQTGALLQDLMKGEGNTTFIFEKIGPMLHHIMIDEFQDTSHQQWNNFKPLIEELMANMQKNLVVGDVKQSIYRWRNGDWRILQYIGNDFPEMVKDNVLEDNFRSDKVIIGFNNYVFPRIAAALEQKAGTDDNMITKAYQDVMQYVPDVKKDLPAKGRVRVRLYNKKDDYEQHYDDFCQQIVELHEQGVPYGKMTILVRKNKSTPVIIEAMRNNPKTKDIKLVSADAFMFQSSLAIQMVVSALRYLENGKDTISKTYVAYHYQNDILKKNLSDEDFFAMDVDSLLPEILQSGIPDEKGKYSYDILKKMPLYELNEQLVAGMNLGNLAGQAEFIMAYLDSLTAYASRNPSDIKSFLKYWDDILYKKAITNTDNNALQVMTIHKSKGLAFDYVLMPECNFNVNSFQQNSIYWLSTEGKGDIFKDIPVLPIDFHATNKIKNSVFAEDFLEESRQQLLDAINMLYVAFTRAKKGLYIWGMNVETQITGFLQVALHDLPAKVDDDVVTYCFDGDHLPPEYDKMFHPNGTTEEIKGVPASESRLEPKFEEEDAEKNKLKTIPCEIGTTAFKPVFRQSTESQKYGFAEDDSGRFVSMNKGTLFHNILRNIYTTSDLDLALRQCAQDEAMSEEEESQFRELFEAGMKNAEVRAWFSGDYEVYNEQNILTLQDGTPKVLRPDRVMMSKDGKQVVVVDYKFTTYASLADKPLLSEYQHQVLSYMQMLQEMLSDKEVKGYLWFMYDNQVKEVKDGNNE